MSTISELYTFFKECPELGNLWSIGASEDKGVRVILPSGASDSVQYDETIDICGNYECEIIPLPSVYEDFQINCYELYDSADDNQTSDNINIMSYDEVRKICNWIATKNANGELPTITDKKIISLECHPFVPQIRYVDTQENIIAYFITVRLRYVNPTVRRSVVYEADN